MGDPCCYTMTSSGTVKIIERFGAFKSIARPGCAVKMPCIDCISGTISMRLQQMEVDCETKTKDNVFLTIRVAIQYQVIAEDKAIHDAHYRLTNPRTQIESYVFDVIRSEIPKIDLDDGRRSIPPLACLMDDVPRHVVTSALGASRPAFVRRHAQPPPHWPPLRAPPLT